MLSDTDTYCFATGGMALTENPDLVGSTWSMATGGFWEWYSPYADAMELYRYFPTFIKYQDSQAGLDDDGEALLQKITWCLEKESGAHSEMVRQLILNLDRDYCNPRLLNYLAYIFGERIPGSWGDEQRRHFLKALPDLLKIKGEHLGFVRRAAFHDRKDVFLVELFKTQLYEDRAYSMYRGASYPYQSARIDILACISSCESWCETLCEAGTIEGARLTSTMAEGLLDDLGEVLPVHVLLRKDVRVVEPSYPFFPSYDTLGCVSVCETWCETACETAEESWPGSYVEAALRDRFTMPRDLTSYSTECITACESACQTCCECGAEGTCTVGCEVVCEVVCEDICQGACMMTCQTGCQAGGCEWGCQVYCEDYCETVCEAGVEP